MFKNIYHYLMIKKARLFDKRYYLMNYSDVVKADIDPLWHFVYTGWKEFRNPSPFFNTDFYLKSNIDVKQSGINPLIHYIRYGKKEGRRTIPLSYKEKHKSVSNYINKKNPDVITLFLHIGQNKTGTSAIQNFLDVNRKFLSSEVGCLYPNFEADDLISGACSNHSLWHLSVLKNENKLMEDFDRIIGFSKKNKIDKIILSNEGWFLNSDVIQIFKKLLGHNFPLRIKPICYIRRIDHWVESAWKQWGIKEYETLDEFVNLPKHFRLFERGLSHLEMWNEVIDKENIIVRPYEKQQLELGLLHDFLALIDIDSTAYELSKIINQEQTSNTGFNRDVVEILHICRKLFSDVHDNHLFHLFTELLGDDFRKKPFETYNLLSPQTRWELVSSNLPYEQKIAKIFMKRKDGRIFYEPMPDLDEIWVPYSGITLEKAIPIIIKMIDANHG